MYRDFFYDGQVRRFITQFMRIISNIQVEFGVNRDGVIANISLKIETYVVFV